MNLLLLLFLKMFYRIAILAQVYIIQFYNPPLEWHTVSLHAAAAVIVVFLIW